MNKSEEARQLIVKARVSLLMKMPFFGNLAMMFELIDATDFSWCPTMATDGKKIYYNRDFVLSLQLDSSKQPVELIFVLCHELLHCAFEHFGRRSHRDPDWWNMATDYVINGCLTKEGVGKMPMKYVTNEADGSKGQQRVGLYDERYTKPELWTSEAVYDDLQKRKVTKQLTMDVHIPMGNERSPGNGNKINGNTDMPSVSEEELKEIQSSIKEKLIIASNAAAGNMPESIKRLISNLLDPMIDWKELIQQNINSCLTDDFTFMKINRRGQGSGIFLPTLKTDETIDVAVAIDMSGSISDEMARSFISEVYGMMECYSSFNISVVCFDTQAHNFQEFTKDTQEEMLAYEPMGGGGTDFMAFWDYWIDNEVEPKKAIVFTDGYCSSSGPNNGWGPEITDTTWIIIDGQRSRLVPPFGTYAYFDPSAGDVEIAA